MMDKKMTRYNTTTKLLMAAVHLYPEDFNNDIRERAEHPYKASTTEFGVDIDKVKNELTNSKRSYFIKSTFLFFLVPVTLFIFFQNPEDNIGYILLAIFL